jgi:hypothetical protein
LNIRFKLVQFARVFLKKQQAVAAEKLVIADDKKRNARIRESKTDFRLPLELQLRAGT